MDSEHMKQLPSDMDAEQGFLCSCMNDPRIIGKQADTITPEYFHWPANSIIWQAMTKLFMEKKAVDLLTVTSQIRSEGKLEEIGGEHYITQVATIIYTGANWKEYLDVVTDCYIRRKIYLAARQMAQDALDRTNSAEDIKEVASKQITGLSSTKTEVFHIGDVLKARIEAWEEAKKSGGAVNRGHPSGFSKWDSATRAFRPQTLHIIAGRAKGGKTTLALQMVTQPAMEKGVPVAIISLEMTKEEIVDKFTACHSQIAINDLRDGKLTKPEYGKITNTVVRGVKAPIYIVDEAHMTVNQFRARARRLVVENKVEIIMLDYAQLVTPSNPKENRERQVAEISRMAKIVAKELNVCIVLLAQLNEDNSVRESRTFEMDCDSLTKILPNTESDDLYAGFMQITHNRNGSTPEIPIRFIKHQARLEEALNQSHP